ncbi:MAG: hypothetical protein HC799_01480 [Limnothrix sp. RL_2_0]|nr:hypothetical protein [Limnothrix sp. RL_2_0]
MIALDQGFGECREWVWSKYRVVDIFIGQLISRVAIAANPSPTIFPIKFTFLKISWRSQQAEFLVRQ